MKYRNAVCADRGNTIRTKKECERSKEVGTVGNTFVVRCLICADKRRMKRFKRFSG